ncbi:hypothetical protein GCM10008983_19560 [Lentibacillus halophilus]|uniref:Uncharacterized protein n=1 Tax=Lentibacillus halophilus TaxID=295065 RepID=A0ABP3J599_9BACI
MENGVVIINVLAAHFDICDLLFPAHSSAAKTAKAGQTDAGGFTKRR